MFFDLERFLRGRRRKRGCSSCRPDHDRREDHRDDRRDDRRRDAHHRDDHRDRRRDDRF